MELSTNPSTELSTDLSTELSTDLLAQSQFYQCSANLSFATQS